jgi:hypothetical protein
VPYPPPKKRTNIALLVVIIVVVLIVLVLVASALFYFWVSGFMGTTVDGPPAIGLAGAWEDEPGNWTVLVAGVTDERTLDEFEVVLRNGSRVLTHELDLGACTGVPCTADGMEWTYVDTFGDGLVNGDDLFVLHHVPPEAQVELEIRWGDSGQTLARTTLGKGGKTLFPATGIGPPCIVGSS